MANKNDQLVVAYYVNEDAARAAAEDLKEWDHHDGDVKLGAIAIMTIDRDTGKLHADEVGQRNTKSGALWGTAIGVGVGLLTAGIGLIPGLILGAGGGAAIGSLSHKDVGMSDEAHAEMVEHIKNGGAALAVMADDFEVADTLAKMVEFGGRTAAFEVPRTTQEVMSMTAAAQASAADALDEVTDEAAEATRSVALELPDVDSEAADVVGKLSAAAGISLVEAAKLQEAGVSKPSDILKMAATPNGRKELAEMTGWDEAEVLYAVKRMDLMRVKGVGVVYSTLLLETGVDTVPELARRNAENLTKAMAETNASESIAEDLPSVEMTTDWVAQAKDLPRVIVYS